MNTKDNFTSYSYRNSSIINKFVRNTLEELNNDTQDRLGDQIRQNDLIEFDSFENFHQKPQCFNISRIKTEPSSFDFDDIASSTRMSFSPSSSENFHEEAKQSSIADGLNKNTDDQENHPPIWKYEMESTQDTENSSASSIQTSSKIREGNTNRLLDLFEASQSDFRRSKENSKDNQEASYSELKNSKDNSNDHQENVSSNEISSNEILTPHNQIIAVKHKKLCDIKKMEEDDAYQFGRQKGIREILASLVSPISAPNMSASYGSPDLSLSRLEKENIMLLNKWAGNTGSLTRTNFEDTSNVYAANISKEESRVTGYAECNESKSRKVDEKLEHESLIKIWLKPFWNTDVINKEDYKNVMLKCVRKVSCWREDERSSVNIRRLVEFFIKRIRNDNRIDKSRSAKKSGSKKKTASKISETEPLLNDISNNNVNIHTKKSCSGKGTNIQITIKQSNCCNNKKQSCCKKSKENNSNRIVSAGEKGANVKRWRY